MTIARNVSPGPAVGPPTVRSQVLRLRAAGGRREDPEIGPVPSEGTRPRGPGGGAFPCLGAPSGVLLGTRLSRCRTVLGDLAWSVAAI